MAYSGGWPPSPMNDAGLRVVQSATWYVYYEAYTTTYHAVSNGSGGSPSRDIGSTTAITVIQGAINALTNGGLIIIKAGTYSLTAAISLAGKSNIHIQGEGASTILQVAASTSITAFIVSTSTDCIIEQMMIDGNQANNSDGGVYTSQCGIFGNPTTRLTLKNVTVKNCVYSGIFIRNDTASIIEQCYCVSNGKTGVGGGVAAGVLIDGIDNAHYSLYTKVRTSQADSNLNWGFSVGDFTEYVQFIGCAATSNSTNFDLEPGVFANNAWVKCLGCSATNGTARNFYITGSRCQIISCESQGSAVGIRVEGSTHVIADNTVISSSQEGIQLSTVTRSIVVGNLVYGSGRTGIWMGANQYVVNSGNVLYQCGNNTTYPAILLTSTATNNLVANNIIEGNSTGLFAIQESTSADNNNEIRDNTIFNTIGTISKSGAGSRVQNNRGYNPNSTGLNGATVQASTKAGTPSDTDFVNPQDGLVVVDTTGNKIWVRTGGVWKGATVA